MHEELIEQIKSDLTEIACGPIFDDLGALFERVSEAFKILAISHAERENWDEYRTHLCRSGQARRYLLQTLKAPVENRYAAASCVGPFMAAWAAGDLSLARDIAAASPTVWQKDWEYEDDFYYARFLYELLLRPTTVKKTGGPILDSFEKALEAQASNRLEVCRALMGRDVERFNRVFEALMKEEQNRWTAEAEKPRDEEIEEWMAERRTKLSIEGLALLNAAGSMGLPTEKSYPLCPPGARFRPQENLENIDLFSEIEKRRAPETKNE